MNRHTRLTMLAALVVASSCLAVVAQDINPFPRQVLRADVLRQWTFAGGVAGWHAQHDCKLAATGGVLRITSSGTDPYLISGPIKIAGPLTARLRAKCATGGTGQFFWTLVENPHTAEERSAHFKLTHDGQWHDYSVPLDIQGTLTHLRLDPGGAPGIIEVEKLELVRETLHPLEIQSIRAVGRQVTLTLTNHSDQTLTCRVAERSVTLPGHAAQSIAITADGSVPFETREVVVQAEGLPPLRRTIFLADENAAGDFVALSSPELTVRVARDGSGARLELGGKLVGFVAPLVWRNGALPRLKLVGEKDGLQFVGEGVSLALKLKGAELAVAIQSAEPCEGPVLRALGGLEQGLFAGVEYLGKNERSSSTLDIDTEEHIRYAPDPLKVTMPLMAFATAPRYAVRRSPRPFASGRPRRWRRQSCGLSSSAPGHRAAQPR